MLQPNQGLHITHCQCSVLSCTEKKFDYKDGYIPMIEEMLPGPHRAQVSSKTWGKGELHFTECQSGGDHSPFDLRMSGRKALVVRTVPQRFTSATSM